MCFLRCKNDIVILTGTMKISAPTEIPSLTTTENWGAGMAGPKFWASSTSTVTIVTDDLKENSIKACITLLGRF